MNGEITLGQTIEAEDSDSKCSPPVKVVPYIHAGLKPSLYLLKDTRESRTRYLNKRLSLQLAASNNDLVTAESIIKDDENILGAAITTTEETALHMATGAKHKGFVKKLVKLMNKDDLTLQNCKGNTAFCYAAIIGDLEIAKILLRENERLALIRGGAGMTPLYLAACFGHAEMAYFLYPMTKHVLDNEEWIALFFTCIHSRLYGVALKMLEDDKTLALARDVNQETALHILAKTPTAFGHQSRPRTWKKIYTKSSTFLCLKSSNEETLIQRTQSLQLVRRLWKEILLETDWNIFKQLINVPSGLLFDAAELGNFQFLFELINSYPELIWETDEKSRTIFHIAVLNRHKAVFDLIYKISPFVRDVIVTYEDCDNNNILHLAAELPPSGKLNPQLGGTVSQFRHELLWFKAVKKIVQPCYAERKNSKGLTPKDLFSITHEKLLIDGERWTKSIAKSCILISAIIAVGVFLAAFASNNRSFSVITISEAISLFSSSTAMVTFLWVLTSSFAEMDFLVSVPLKLIFGIATFFISMAAMMVAFYGRLFLYPHMD